MKITTIGLDIAKSVFHLYGVNGKGKLVIKKMLKRREVLTYFSQLTACAVAMEACGSAHYWARELKSLGHDVKLIAPQYVKPYVKGNKNDYNDAEGIAEAAQRPNMRFVPIKSLEQQDIQLLHCKRSRLIKQRTGLANQLRGQLAEYGLVLAKGIGTLRRELPYLLEDAENGLTVKARHYFNESYEELILLDEKCKLLDKKLEQLAKSNEVCNRLMKIPGIGFTTASALCAAIGDGKGLANGRHLSAWLGLVPKQHSSGGKDTLLGMSKRGNSYIRTLLIHGARAVLQYVDNKTDKLSVWAAKLKERSNFNVACVGLANKLARIAWVIMAREEEYKVAV